MRYLVTAKDDDGAMDTFYTDYFSAENTYVDGMIVVDLVQDLVTYDGRVWHRIDYDHL